MLEECADVLGKVSLFKDIETKGALILCEEMRARLLVFKGRETIIGEGTENHNMYILISGGAVGEKSTADGRTVTVNDLKPGDIFGDVLSGSSTRSPVTVRANGGCKVLGFLFEAVLSACAKNDELNSRLLRNLILEISDKYFALNRRVEILIENRIRRKIAIYLQNLLKSGESAKIKMPHKSREDLAQYLSCDRSALCRELSRMKSDGIIDYNKNTVTVKDIGFLGMLAQ
ncbi:MAG: Crp/Fnr family transcriptional regulator [Oscillospiraceae bacterium]